MAKFLDKTDKKIRDDLYINFLEREHERRKEYNDNPEKYKDQEEVKTQVEKSVEEIK